MAQLPRAEPGIDFFDFLYEIWRAKWLFLAVALIVGLLTMAPALLAGRAAPPAEPAQFRAFAIGFSLNIANDPVQRKPAEIIADLVSRAMDDGLPQIINIAPGSQPAEPVPAYWADHSSATNRGEIRVLVPAGQEDVFNQFHTALVAAAEEQVSDVRAQLERDAETVRTIVSQYGVGDTDYLTRQLFIALRFPTLPGVRTGEFRFVELGEAERVEMIEQPAAAPGRGLRRAFIIALLAGGIAGTFAVMVRIAIERKRERGAA
jgi:hypothetical protein